MSTTQTPMSNLISGNFDNDSSDNSEDEENSQKIQNEFEAVSGSFYKNFFLKIS